MNSLLTQSLAQTSSAEPEVPDNYRPVEYSYVTDDETVGFGRDAMAWDVFLGRRNIRDCRLSYENTTAFNCAITDAQSGIRPSVSSRMQDLYNSAESEIFLGITQRLKSVTDCQLNLADSYLGRQGSSTPVSSEVQSRINAQFHDKFVELAPVFRDIESRLNELKAERGGRLNFPATAGNPQRVAEINREIVAIEAARSLMVQEFPMGNQTKVHEQLLEAFKNGANENQARTAFRSGLSQFQGQLASSSRRLDWALATPARASAFRELRDSRCQRSQGRRASRCQSGRSPANDSERADLSYGLDVGPPGITNEFKQEVLGGNMNIIDDYFNSLSLSDDQTSGMKCQIQAFHVDGAAIESNLKVAAEIGGIFALSLLIPPAGAAAGAASAAATGARSVTMAARLMSVGARAGAYAATLAPALPSIAAACLGPNSPAFLNYANIAPNMQCSAANSLSFTTAESQFSECSTELAITALEATVPAAASFLRGRFARRLAARSSRGALTAEAELAEAAASRAGRALDTIESNEIVVTGTRRNAGRASNSRTTASQRPSLNNLDSRNARQLERLSLRDREELDGILNRLGGRNPNEYVSEMNQDIDDFLARNSERLGPQDAASVRELHGRLIRERGALTSRRVRDDLRQNLRTAETRRVDCQSLNRLNENPAFHLDSPCHAVTFRRRSQNYCACGGTNGIGAWLAPCPTGRSGLRTQLQHFDMSALPTNSSVQFCRRASIEPGTTCYHGGLGPVMSGYGGGAQLFCEGGAFKPSARSGERMVNVRGADGTVTQRRRVDIAREEGLLPANKTEFQDVRVINITPVSSDPELNRIYAIGSQCTQRGNASCDVGSIRRLRNELNDYFRRNPNATQDREYSEMYFEYLTGRRSLDSQGRFSDLSTPARPPSSSAN